MKGEVETQFLLSGLLLHTQPLHSSEKHTRAHLEFSSHFDYFARVVAVKKFWMLGHPLKYYEARIVRGESGIYSRLEPTIGGQ